MIELQRICALTTEITWRQIFMTCGKTFATKTEVNNLHFAVLQLKSDFFWKGDKCLISQRDVKKTWTNEEILLSHNHNFSTLVITSHKTYQARIFFWVGSAKRTFISSGCFSYNSRVNALLKWRIWGDAFNLSALAITLSRGTMIHAKGSPEKKN